jgi:hypothetical protein
MPAGALLNPGTSYLRYRGEYILPATQLLASPQGPAVWRVSGAAGLSVALNNLLQEPLERRSRGHAAAQVGVDVDTELWMRVSCLSVPGVCWGRVAVCSGGRGMNCCWHLDVTACSVLQCVTLRQVLSWLHHLTKLS